MQNLSTCVDFILQLQNTWNGRFTTQEEHRILPEVQKTFNQTGRTLPPIVLSWYSWNWPLTKRSTKLDFPTADSPKSTNLNWQILLLAAVPLVRAGPPRPAIVQCWRLWRETEEEVTRPNVEGWWLGWSQDRQVDVPEEEGSQLEAGRKTNNHLDRFTF